MRAFCLRPHARVEGEVLKQEGEYEVTHFWNRAKPEAVLSIRNGTFVVPDAVSPVPLLYLQYSER
jgi:hypothetical protein